MAYRWFDVEKNAPHMHMDKPMQPRLCIASRQHVAPPQKACLSVEMNNLLLLSRDQTLFRRDLASI